MRLLTLLVTLAVFLFTATVSEAGLFARLKAKRAGGYSSSAGGCGAAASAYSVSQSRTTVFTSSSHFTTPVRAHPPAIMFIPVQPAPLAPAHGTTINIKTK